MKPNEFRVSTTSIAEKQVLRPPMVACSSLGAKPAKGKTTRSLLSRMIGLASAALVLALPQLAKASTAYGTLNNFDCVNDTGVEAHGFEIELDDIHSKDITYTYDYNHYGVPKITEDNADPLHPKVFIRYAGSRNPDGTWTAYTAIPAGPIAPTQGHQFTDPSVNFGGEHFGAGYYGAPSAVKYNWLIDDGSGVLIHGAPVYVSTPTFTYYPPAPAQVVPQVQAVVVPPPPPVPPVLQFGQATWVKDIKTSTHNAGKVELVDLRDPDPENPGAKDWANGEPAEVETEWRVLQTEFANAGNPKGELKGLPEDLPGGDEVITRRYEFYKYVGPIDAESGEAMADQVAADGIHGVGTVTYIDSFDALGEPVEVTVDLSTVVIVGDFFGAQMAGFDIAPALGLIDHIPDGELNVPYAERTVVVGGGAGFLATVSGALPDGTTLDEVTGIFSGTPTVAGVFTFKVDAEDLAGAIVSKTYTVTIAGDQAPPATYTVDTSSSPVAGGATSGGGTFNSGDSVTVVAAANAGYTFVSWTESGAVVSGVASYTFTADSNRSLVAQFAPITYVINTSASPLAGGTVGGGGTFNGGNPVTVIAAAKAGYHFVSWTEGGVAVSGAASYTFIASAYRSLVANFAPISYVINASASPAAGGSVSGGGTFNSGDAVTVVAVANAGYTFVNWTEGGAVVSATPSYTFAAGGDRSLVANFTPITYVISASASPAAGGSVSGGGTYNSGDTVTVAAVANAGYSFLNWTEGGAVVSATPSYTFAAGGDRSLVANFAQITYVINASASPAAGGSVSGSGTFNSGDSVTLVAVANAGYSFLNWTEGGTVVSGTPSYTFVASGDRALVATFAPISTSVRIKEIEVDHQLVGGMHTSGEVELASRAPAGGITVQLFSSNTNVLRVPTSVFVPAGRKCASFPINVLNVKRATTVSVTAKLGRSQESANVKVVPRRDND